MTGNSDEDTGKINPKRPICFFTAHRAAAVSAESGQMSAADLLRIPSAVYEAAGKIILSRREGIRMIRIQS